MKYSNFDEEIIIKKILGSLKIEKGICVDIGASDGIEKSNVYTLFMEGWTGLSAECDPAKFTNLAKTYQDLPGVALCRHKITPHNIAEILKGTCKHIDFINIDISTYDYFILEGILKGQLRPKLICIEINENIPPPVKFTVKYSPEHYWEHGIFFGHSISLLYELCQKHDYCLVGQEYCNAFLIPKENCPVKAMTPEESWYRGYYDRSDKKEKLKNDWALIDKILSLPGEEKITCINEVFARWKGEFICTL